MTIFISCRAQTARLLIITDFLQNALDLELEYDPAILVFNLFNLLAYIHNVRLCCKELREE